MTTVLAFVLAAMQVLVPGRDHSELGTSIAEVVDQEAPLFAGDPDKLRTAAFLVAVAHRESTLRLDAVGDQGRARCAFQLWSAPKEVLTDAGLCTRIAYGRLRESMRACGVRNPLGIYAAGPNGCRSAHAERISRDRLALARRTLEAVVAKDGAS